MQLRNLLGFLATASTLVFIALNVYPFQPMGTLTNFATFLFALGAIVVVTVFYQMEKDPLLSRLANTTAGKLESGFTLRLLQFGTLPTVTFLATHFPPIGQALVSTTGSQTSRNPVNQTSLVHPGRPTVPRLKSPSASHKHNDTIMFKRVGIADPRNCMTQ